MTGENLLVSHRPSVTVLTSSDSDRSLVKKNSDGQNGTGQPDKKRKISASSMDNPVYTINENRAESFSRLQEANGGLSRSQNGLSKSQDSLPESSHRNLNRHASVDSTISIATEDEEVDEYGEVIVSDEKLKKMRRVHHVIIDCTPINYIDASGSNVLCHIFSEYSHVHIQVFLAGVSADVRRAMKHAGAFEKIPSDHIFLEVSDAIAVARTKQVEALSEQELEDFSDEEANEDSYVTKM